MRFLPSDGGAAGSRTRLVAEAESDELLQQLLVVHAGMLGRVGEVLVAGDLRVGVGFQQIELAVVAQAVVQARVAAQVQQPIDALGGAGDVLCLPLVELAGPVFSPIFFW